MFFRSRIFLIHITYNRLSKVATTVVISTGEKLLIAWFLECQIPIKIIWFEQTFIVATANSVVWNFKWDFKIILAPFGLSVLHEGRKRSKNYIFSQTRKGRKFYQIRPQGRNILLILFQKEITQWGEIISDAAFLFFKLCAPLQGKQSSF